MSNEGMIDGLDRDGNVVEGIDETCPRCGAGMQATHHALCEHRDGTPTG